MRKIIMLVVLLTMFVSMPTSAAVGEAHPGCCATVASVQCKGTTQKGLRCKRMTNDPSGYCYQHKPAPRPSPGG